MNLRERLSWFVIALFLLVQVSYSLDNGLARTPPMGWMTWERFRCNTDCVNFPADCIGERLIKETADRMVADGYLKAGYEYVTIDDCWMAKERTADGKLQADPSRFPNGMKSVADYVHSKGLKFGIYEDFGTKTCGGYPGSEFHMESDANTFASWGVDLVKFDGCYSSIDQQVEGYEVFGFYLNKTGRPMVYSCSWPAYQYGQPSLNSASLIKTCSMWRIFGDIQDSWDSVASIINLYKTNKYSFQTWAGPGHWNDPDMLIIGDFGLSYEQERSQMAMWAMFAAPMLMSVDLRRISNESRIILQNPRLIALNQDPAGQQASLVTELGSVEIWSRKLFSGAVAVAFLNKDTAGTPTRLLYQLPSGKSAQITVTEMFTGAIVGKYQAKQSIPVVVNPTGVVLYLLT